MNLDPAGAIASGPLERRDEHVCGACRERFVVVYEAEPGEPLEPAPVACPHCWRLGQVPVAREARWRKDYRADKA
jgi:hypothetical protein